MVYRGKPSQSCAECRKRRNRCDLKRPSCTQCVRAKRTCTGYRDVLDVMFCDQSSKVATLAQGESGRSQDCSREHQQGQDSTIVAQRAGPTRFTDVVFYQPLNELAITFFMNTYVGGEIVHSQFDYLPAMYARHYTNASLQECIRAVGLAAYAKATRRKDLLEPAIKSYVLALRNVNSTISTPSKAVQDSTLICILLLAMFEVMTRTKGLGNLTNHLNGAMLIGNLLLKKERQTEFSEQLLGTIYQSVILNCWIQSLPLPDGFDALQTHSKRTSRIPKLQSRLLEGLTGLINFRHKLREERRSPPSVKIAYATSLDDQLRCLLDDMPNQGDFQKVYTPVDEHLAYKSYYHIYPKNFTAHMWNNIRSSRIRLHSYISTQCERLLSPTSRETGMAAFAADQLHTSQNLVCTLATEILATVPQLAGYLAALPTPSASADLHSQTDTGMHLSTTTSFEAVTCPLSTPTFTYAQTPLPNPDTMGNTAGPSLLYPPVGTPDDTSIPGCNLEPPQVIPIFPVPRPASPYHLLYVLYMLSTIMLLPADMHGWVKQRIAYVEKSANKDDLALLHALRENAPMGAFPFFAHI
ncbi:hypothetical protein K491DRAFT_675375 [Lophiostoma macrostomum CBS 122681]|uniref:Zn(2)-C6 fungal-type domain-containing protein n=1 Tax=Lophiostoma macrostomum CBS 122681 TaxID=1314788 RepID=A0A6A6TIR9_9PLEO|nr:hypothetical protein K491DRAFT_675375 [Lophiostoma macrostomum CBS 122681]